MREARSLPGALVSRSSSPSSVGVTFCRWKSPEPDQVGGRRAIRPSVPSRRLRPRGADGPPRTASWRRSHQYPRGCAGQVDPGQQVRGPAERAPCDGGGDPAAQGRGDKRGFGREQPLVLRAPFMAAPRQPARRGGGHGGVGDDMARHVGGVQDPGGGPGGQDDGQRQPLGRGVQVPGAQPRPRRLGDQDRLVAVVLRVPRDRAGPGVLGLDHRVTAIQGVSARARRGSPGRGRCRVVPAQAPSPVTQRPSWVIRPPLAANSRGSS